MVIKSVEIEKFRSFTNVHFSLGKRITAISGRNATQKTTVLGMIGQPFTISKDHPMYGCKTIDGYNFRSQFKEKFKISPTHDIIGEHRWKLNLHNGVYGHQYYAVESIARNQSGQEPTLRFWNAESRSKGAGYVQLPVYFLSLGRLFPIGETGKTNSVPITLTQDELDYCIRHYRTILSIQAISGEPTVGVEKAASSKTFAGVSDNLHDVFTNSAGEGNITRIILAILSFKRLKEQYGRDYKGGLLLIDELDATLYGFSQKKLVDFLWEAAGEFRIQIVFTTHSPVILKQVDKYQRIERRSKGINLPLDAYDSSIVYLEPCYDQQGQEVKRTIMPHNISSSNDLTRILNDMNLSLPTPANKVNIYCEDERAIAFAKFVLQKVLAINLDMYMSFVDINLGWTNYVQLVQKKVPEFLENIIILDGDVPLKKEYESKSRIVEEAGNIVFLPLVIEKGLFDLLKDHAAYERFRSTYSNAPSLTYDICFNEWPLETEMYSTEDFKHWYHYIENALGDQKKLFAFWCDENSDLVDAMVTRFVGIFNRLAEHKEIDVLPQNTQLD